MVKMKIIFHYAQYQAISKTFEDDALHNEKHKKRKTQTLKMQ